MDIHIDNSNDSTANTYTFLRIPIAVTITIPSDNSYPIGSAEASQKRLADYLFMMQDYVEALNIYRRVSKDYENDKVFRPFHSQYSISLRLSMFYVFLLDNQSLIPLSIYTLNRNGNTLEQHVKWEDCVPFCWILPLPRDSILILMLLLPAMSKVRERERAQRHPTIIISHYHYRYTYLIPDT